MNLNSLDYQFFNKCENTDKCFINIQVFGSNKEDIAKIIDSISIDNWTKDKRTYILLKKEITDVSTTIFFKLDD